jgi:chromate transporter
MLSRKGIMPEPSRPQGGRISRSRNLWELAGVFLRLGTTAFGGPAAHIAMMEDEVVRRRGWLSPEEFLDLLGATNLIPGPNSTEMAIHIGRRRAGWPGYLVAGSCFILPAVAIVLAVSWAYVRFSTLPQAESLLYGVKPVIIAIVAHAIVRLARTAVKSAIMAIVGAAAAAASFVGMNELALLLAAGAVVALGGWVRTSGRKRARPRGFCLGSAFANAAKALAGGAAVAAAAPYGLGVLFLYFCKIGAILYGSGYVLLAFLRADFVNRLHWITEGQLLDAVAVGQMTPGPVFTTATFIGFLLGGIKGACVATAGIFLPAFAFVAASGPLVPKLRRSKIAGAFLDGVVVASLGLLVTVTWHLGRVALLDFPTVLLALASAALLGRLHVNAAWILALGAASGLLIRALG